MSIQDVPLNYILAVRRLWEKVGKDAEELREIIRPASILYGCSITSIIYYAIADKRIQKEEPLVMLGQGPYLKEIYPSDV